MKYIQLKSLVLCLVFCNVLSFTALSQNSPEVQWGKSIAGFAKQDSVSMPQKDGILLLGSSSFTIWRDILNYFPGRNIINRGFGGSQMSDVLYFKDRLILPYHPKHLVIYEGENDIASGEKPDSILSELIQLVTWTRNQIPGIRISLISMKPSPSRWKIRAQMLEMNTLLKQYASQSENIDFINIWDVLLGPDGKPIKENYLPDSLHLNANGYKIWQKAMDPFLK